MPNLDDELNGLINKLTHDVDEASTVDAIWQRTAQRRRGHAAKRVGLIAVAAAIAIASFIPLSSAFRKNHVVSAPSSHPTQAPVTGTPVTQTPTPSPTPTPLPPYDVKGTLVLTNGFMGATNQVTPIFTARGLSTPKRIVIPYIRPNAYAGALSPDGTKVAVDANDFMPVGPGNDLMMVDLTTGQVTRIAWLDPSGESWSPRGDMIALWNGVHTTKGVQVGWDLVRPDGTLIRQLTSEIWDGSCWDSGISWSRDASKLTFGRFCRSGADAGVSVYVISADGSAIHKLVHLGRVSEFLRTPVGAPTFSPDGNVLAFETRNGVYVMGADGSNLHRIASGVTCPVWSPDGSVFAVGGSGGVQFINMHGTPVGAIRGTAGKAFCPTNWYPSP